MAMVTCTYIDRLLHTHNGRLNEYRQEEDRARRGSVKWQLRHEDVYLKEAGKVCTVREADHD